MIIIPLLAKWLLLTRNPFFLLWWIRMACETPPISSHREKEKKRVRRGELILLWYQHDSIYVCTKRMKIIYTPLSPPEGVRDPSQFICGLMNGGAERWSPHGTRYIYIYIYIWKWNSRVIGLGSLPFSLSIIRRKGMIEFLALYANGRRESTLFPGEIEREALLFLPTEMDFSILIPDIWFPPFCVCLYKFNDIFLMSYL